MHGKLDKSILVTDLSNISTDISEYIKSLIRQLNISIKGTSLSGLTELIVAPSGVVIYLSVPR